MAIPERSRTDGKCSGSVATAVIPNPPLTIKSTEQNRLSTLTSSRRWLWKRPTATAQLHWILFAPVCGLKGLQRRVQTNRQVHRGVVRTGEKHHSEDGSRVRWGLQIQFDTSIARRPERARPSRCSLAYLRRSRPRPEYEPRRTGNSELCGRARPGRGWADQLQI